MGNALKLKPFFYSFTPRKMRTKMNRTENRTTPKATVEIHNKLHVHSYKKLKLQM